MGSPRYDGVVSIAPASKSLRALWRIAFVRSARTRDSVTFLLNDALRISRISGPDVRGHGEGAPADGMKRVTVRFAPEGDTIVATTLEFEYGGVPNLPGDGINGVSSEWVELALDSFWLPIFDDFAQAITATVLMELPSGWTAVASGSVKRADEALALTN
ncbi:MAG: hypothetical protein ACT4PJ_14065 [Gemmatimonadaceae bacterium]